MYKNICRLALLLLLLSMAEAKAQQPSDDYVLVFRDEFKGPRGSQPDASKWSCPHRNPSTWARWISPSRAVAFLRGGKLVCRAIPNTTEPGDTARMLTGAVESLGKFSFQYGKVEVRMKTNLKQGNFPAIWMKPSDTKTDDRYGEIDIVETYGYKKASFHTIHTHETYTLKKRKPTEFSKDIDISRWHVYGVEWTPDSIVWTVDGASVGVYRKSSLPEDLRNGQWTFDRPFYLRLNQSLGDGSYPRFTPMTNEEYETRFDWVRVYQKKH